MLQNWTKSKRQSSSLRPTDQVLHNMMTVSPSENGERAISCTFCKSMQPQGTSWTSFRLGLSQRVRLRSVQMNGCSGGNSGKKVKVE
ncbi:Uncharacterized protein DAT39_001858 [Clarias magur]|uniref:Uncharacterized protein n=1 Tax=Clarias magur TaxID=1594786 RepID=A0A8J4U7Q6_CLAMG|nr:Uncharacterized protein DAT39_001858 [Clarias magur]